jgi:hypothetical protein
MHLSSESLRPINQPANQAALNTVVLLADESQSEAPAAHATTAVAHDPIAQAARAVQRIACRSFHVPGAQVDVTRVLFGILPWLSAERCDVENVSKGGVAFECRMAMTAGESIELQLRVPGERGPITLKGEVTWCKRARYGGYRIGARFAPYGETQRSNPRAALAALRALEAKHA